MNTIKNSIFFTALLLFVIAFSACEKEAGTTSETKIAIEQQIIDFIDKTNDPVTLKSGELMSLDSAIWFTEAAGNYTNRVLAQGDNYNGFAIDSFFVSVPVSNGQVLFTDVATAYTEIVAQSQSIYNTMASENKDFHLLDVQAVEGEEGTLKVTTSVATERSIIVGRDWIWGKDFGSCDGIVQNWDAADEFEYVVYTQKTDEFPYLNSDTYFVDILDLDHASMTDYFYVIEGGITGDLPEPCILKEDLYVYIKNFLINMHQHEQWYSRSFIAFNCNDETQVFHENGKVYTLKRHAFELWFGTPVE